MSDTRFTVVINNKKYDVEVYEQGDNVFLVKIGDREYIVHLSDEFLEEVEKQEEEEVTSMLTRAIEESVARTQQPLYHAEEQGLILTSEFPGRLVKLLIKEGDLVNQGQTVAVVESMKMMIEIRSPYRGKVKKVLAQEGKFIDVGQAISVIEPL
uniref:Acetyl-CoA carboxylase biotin carboxyl carrier protein subunit n=1 Tax=Ignisphaera aggregans TaxID=334771 RepID=A0A7C2ZPC0_9CREN